MKKWLKIAIGVVVGIILLLIIDLLCIFTINKPLLAVKQDNGDSVNLVYRGLLYDTYICHEQSVPQIKVKGAKYTCAAIIFDDQTESNFQQTEVENVSISISDISLTGATVVIKDTNKKPYTQGEWYKIEKEVDGKWQDVEPIIDNYAFNSIGYEPDENNEVKHEIDWKWIYGELPLGSYRILKEVGNKKVSIEFSIATTSDKKMEIIKSEVIDLNKFNKYLERENRIVYLSGSIDEIYLKLSSGKKITLKYHFENVNQSLERSIEQLVDDMELTAMLKDGGTIIHKSSEYDITIVKCNTIAGNKDIFIGDYSMKFDSESMCK